MNTIKGFLLKDLYNLLNYKSTLFICFIIVVVFGISGQIQLLPIILITMIGMIGLSTFSYDEISKTDKYLLSMPTSKKEIVLAKYLLSILMIVVGAILAFVITFGIGQIAQHFPIQAIEEIPTIQDIAIYTVGGIFGISLITCIQIPSIYKWGAERGRIQMFLLVILITAIVGGIIFLIGKVGFSINVQQLERIFEQFGILILFVVTIIMYVISYHISKRIYQKKEF